MEMHVSGFLVAKATKMQKKLFAKILNLRRKILCHDIVSACWEGMQRPVATIFLVPAIIIALLIGIVIWPRSPGLIIIRQKREGFGGNCFFMFKLRTMFIDAEERIQRHFAEIPEAIVEWRDFGCLRNDPRIAGRVARFARRYSIDELPQLINVVLGQMNIVGPRPLPLNIVTYMIPADRKIRQKVLPGITGLWQVSGRSDLKIKEIGRLDRIYVMKRNLWLDLSILAKTAGTVIRGRGAY